MTWNIFRFGNPKTKTFICDDCILGGSGRSKNIWKHFLNIRNGIPELWSFGISIYFSSSIQGGPQLVVSAAAHHSTKIGVKERQLPIYFRPFIGVSHNSIYNWIRGHLARISEIGWNKSMDFASLWWLGKKSKGVLPINSEEFAWQKPKLIPKKTNTIYESEVNTPKKLQYPMFRFSFLLGILDIYSPSAIIY